MTTLAPSPKPAAKPPGKPRRLRGQRLRRAWRQLGLPVEGRIVPGTLVVAGFAALVGVVATVIAWRLDWILNYPDALSHLVIARRIIDSQNPGLFQLGTVWLPAPHLLLIPFVSIFPLYVTGLAGSLLGIGCLAYSAGALWRITSRVGLGRAGKLVAIGVFTLNPTTMYLFTTAQTEPVLIASILGSIAGLAAWITASRPVSAGELAVFAGLPAAVAVMSRYEGWAYVALASAFIALASWRRWRAVKHTIGLVSAFAAPSIAVIIWWLGYNTNREGDALAFIRGPYSAAADSGRLAALGLIPTEGNLGMSFSVLNWALVNIVGLGFILLALVGAVVLGWTRGLSTTGLLLWLTGFIYPFQLLTLFLGQTYIRNPQFIPADAWTDNRYAYGALPFVAILCGVAVDALRERRPRAGRLLAVATVGGALAFSAWNIADSHDRMAVIKDGLYETPPPGALEATAWLRENYTGGGILLDDDPQGTLLRLGIPLSEVTNVFNGEIFDKTLLDPEEHVEWLFVNTANTSSPVWRTVSEDPNFRASFVAVFESGTFAVLQNMDADPPPGEVETRTSEVPAEDQP